MTETSTSRKALFAFRVFFALFILNGIIGLQPCVPAVLNYEHFNVPFL